MTGLFAGSPLGVFGVSAVGVGLKKTGDGGRSFCRTGSLSRYAPKRRGIRTNAFSARLSVFRKCEKRADSLNFANRLKTLHGLTPYEAICNAWTNEPNRFTLDPIHLTSGLNT
jgi:hypothetical protein